MSAGGGGLQAWVRRFSVDETRRHPGGFTLYKITSVLFPLASPEALTVVSVWKRFSDTQRLQRNMLALHAALHLPGAVPAFAKWSYFRRLDAEVIEERRATTRRLLEFIAEHRLLFTSAEFVNFLQSGYAEPAGAGAEGGGVISSIRAALRLPPEEAPPLEYPADGDPADPAPPLAPAKPTDLLGQESLSEVDRAEEPTRLDVSDIQVFEADDVEYRASPELTRASPELARASPELARASPELTRADSLNTLSSWGSGTSDFFDEIDGLDVSSYKPTLVGTPAGTALPDLISFDVRAAPSTSGGKFHDYHTMDKDFTNNNAAARRPAETSSLSSTLYDSSVNGNDSVRHDRSYTSPPSRLSTCSRQSRSSLASDSYVFEAGYVLSLGARCEDAGDYARAFECYKGGIEKMLVGVQSDTDPHRRSVIREKTDKYLAYAEAIYRSHLCSDREEPMEMQRDREQRSARAAALPASMLRRPHEELARYRVLAALPPAAMLVMHRELQQCYALKVMQKIPNNLTEFDDYFSQKANETKTPILPTNVPYMVQLRSYVETPNLIFLFLDYAPGGKLLDYIDNYVKSVPNTPVREVNLENVFSEPIKRRNSQISKDDNVENPIISDEIKDESRINRYSTNNESCIDSEIGTKICENNESHDKVTEIVSDKDGTGETVISDSDLSVNDLVINSQRLLMNVDSALSDTDVSLHTVDAVNTEAAEKTEVISEVKNKQAMKLVKKEIEKKEVGEKKTARAVRDALPPATVCTWGAELLLALEHLHNAGVVCRDLNPDNLLLGSRGQLLLTYCAGYRERGAGLARLALSRDPPRLHLAPELWRWVGEGAGGGGGGGDEAGGAGGGDDPVCDYWSYGAVMYRLICGRPLSYYHTSVFTSHTELRLPEGLPLDAESLLTQLLTWDPRERLGACGADEVRAHPYFRHVRWDELRDAWSPPA